MMKGKMMLLLPALFAVAAASAGEAVEVRAVNMQFEPQRIQIKPGTTVKWVNHERRTSHTVLFEQEGLPESERFFPGESWQRAFDKPGVYPYRCGPHPEMTGVVEVVE
jgi:plastocyanin